MKTTFLKHFLASIGATLLAACVQLASAQSALTPLTNADVIGFVKMSLTEQAVLNLISEAQSARLARFDLSASGVSDLTSHGVSATLVEAMGRPAPTTARPSTAARLPVAADPTRTPATLKAQEGAVVYYTPEQEKAALYDFAWWSLDQPSSKERPVSTRKEYGEKVLELIKRFRPHPISYDMYRKLNTDGQYLDGKGDALFDTWEKMRSLPKELSRTSVGRSELVTYQWANPDGSSVTGVFRNGFLVSKSQRGLK